MKFAAVLAAATIGLAAAYDESTPCPASEFNKFVPLVSNPNLQVCQKASGWQMVPPTGVPSDAQRAIMCATPACHDLITALEALKPSDCMLVFGTVQLNVKELADTFEASCFA